MCQSRGDRPEAAGSRHLDVVRRMLAGSWRSRRRVFVARGRGHRRIAVARRGRRVLRQARHRQASGRSRSTAWILRGDRPRAVRRRVWRRLERMARQHTRSAACSTGTPASFRCSTSSSASPSGPRLALFTSPSASYRSRSPRRDRGSRRTSPSWPLAPDLVMHRAAGHIGRVPSSPGRHTGRRKVTS
jgi:hypothetical protein